MSQVRGHVVYQAKYDLLKGESNLLQGFQIIWINAAK